MSVIIYQAYNPINGSFYIGKTVKNLLHRQRQHRVEANLQRNNALFHKAIRKYGFETFQWTILDRAKSKTELSKKEIYWVKLFKDAKARLYNLTKGGDGGCTNSYWEGKNIPEETKRKISEGLKKYFLTHKHLSIGKPHTEESKRKIAESKIGIPRSEECRQKLSDKFSGAKNPSAKPIICLTTGEYFEYAKLAAIKYNLDLSSIIKCCKNKQKQTGGMQFAYQTYPQGWRLKE